MAHVEMTAPISVPDDGRLRPQDDVPHEDWVADVDRAGDAPEPFFSGRDGDLRAAAAAMDMVSRGRGRGQTLCFSGAPGAGKTSLMRQLVGWTAQNRSDWLPVVVGGQAALSLPAIIDAIDRARASVLSARDIENAVRTEAARLRSAAGADDGATDAAARWIANLPDTLPAGPVARREWAGARLRDVGVKGRNAAQSVMQFCLDRGVHLAGFGVGPELRDRRDMPWDVLMARMPPGWPGRCVLLCIDEAQQMSGHVAGSCASGFYSDLHAFGTPRGFLVAAFGLGDTEAALDKLGVSRSGSAPGTEGHRWRTVGTMPEHDVRMAVRRCFRACGVRRNTEAQVWEDAIVKASNGWAQHLRHYLAFAVRAALAGDGACRRDDLADMLEAGDAERVAYYKKRIGALGTHEGCAWEIAAHLESHSGISRRTALAAIVSADLRAQGVSEITKEAVDQCLTAAVHAGLLDNDGGAWRIPIPSFRAHLCHEPRPDRRAEVAALPSPAGKDPIPPDTR